MGFIWTNTHEIVYVTDSGIEFYQILTDRKLVKCLKTFNISVDWFVYQVSVEHIFQYHFDTKFQSFKSLFQRFFFWQMELLEM
jgi:hypothetical protein